MRGIQRRRGEGWRPGRQDDGLSRDRRFETPAVRRFVTRIGESRRPRVARSQERNGYGISAELLDRWRPIVTPEEVELCRYLPVHALPYWCEIGEFIHVCVMETAAATDRTERDLYAAATPFVLWCWRSRGVPLERSRIFRGSLVEEFIHLAETGYRKSSKATHRGVLWKILEVVNPAGASRPHRAISRSAPQDPYLPHETGALNSWAISQGTLRRRHDARALLALGLGAGLATREILEVRPLDIRQDGNQLLVTVADRRREVPFFPEWARTIADIVDDVEPLQCLFRPGRLNATAGQVTDFMTRSRTHLDIRPSRMRTTWLLRHLTEGTPPTELLRISGLKTFAALDKIAQIVPKTDAPQKNIEKTF